MEGGVGANIGEEGTSSEGREGEEKSSFFMVGDGMLVWSKRREEGV